MRARLRRPRRVQRVWARLFGYFWQPCRECGRMYGGHETARGGVSVQTPDGWFVVCRACEPLVRHRQQEMVVKQLDRIAQDEAGSWQDEAWAYRDVVWRKISFEEMLVKHMELVLQDPVSDPWVSFRGGKWDVMSGKGQDSSRTDGDASKPRRTDLDQPDPGGSRYSATDR